MLEFLGPSPAGLNGIPALADAKADAAYESGRLVLELVRGGISGRPPSERAAPAGARRPPAGTTRSRASGRPRRPPPGRAA